jgi:hypothetical protein
MINLDEMKAQLNKDLQQELDREAKESGRLSLEESRAGESQGNSEPVRTDPERIEEKIEEINLDKILEEAPEDEKGNKIVSDEIFDKYYKNLPNGTKNQSGTWRVNNSGKLRIFGGDPEGDKEIQRAGAEASNAVQAHRRTLADDLKIALSKKATRATLQALDLQDGATNQDAITAAAILQASEGNVKALQYIRDTIGEQPTAKQDISVQMTEDDKALLDKVQKRLGIDQE